MKYQQGWLHIHLGKSLYFWWVQTSHSKSSSIWIFGVKFLFLHKKCIHGLSHQDYLHVYVESSLSPKLQSSLKNVSKWPDLNVIINSLYFPVSLQTSSIQILKERSQTNPATRTACRKVSNLLPVGHILWLDTKQRQSCVGTSQLPHTLQKWRKRRCTQSLILWMNNHWQSWALPNSSFWALAPELLI